MDNEMAKGLLFPVLYLIVGCVWGLVGGLLAAPPALVIIGVILSGVGMWRLMFREKAPPTSY